MPACLAAADIGVAPFDLDAHKPLTLGFYWSPLKIFGANGRQFGSIADEHRAHVRPSA